MTSKALKIARPFLVAALVMLPLALVPQPASAQLGVDSFHGGLLNEDGTVSTQAGAHPFAASMGAEFATIIDGSGVEVPAGSLKDVFIDLPPGLIGDPSATPKCTQAQFLQEPSDATAGFLPDCPVESQVGLVGVEILSGPFRLEGEWPLYNLVPRGNEPARFGFRHSWVYTVSGSTVRTGDDHGLTITVRDVQSGLMPLVAMGIKLWGVPADPAHDPERRRGCLVTFGICMGGNESSSAPRKPFLTNPTNCAAGPLETMLRARSYQGDAATASFLTRQFDGTPVGMEGCDKLAFDPEIRVRPNHGRADSPSGYQVDLSLPQSDNPDGLATAHLKRAEVKLPEGTAVSPSAAHGLGACSPAQIGLDNASKPTCPNNSKIGTVEIDTPLLDDSMRGDIFQAEQDNNPFGSLLALYVVAEGPGVIVKLAGRVDPDPMSGQLTATFDDNPQLPFNSMRLRFKGGDQAVLANPPTCGQKAVEAAFAPWSASDPDNPSGDELATVADAFAIDSGPGGLPCASTLGARPFGPGFSGGVVNPTAASPSPFVLRVTRPDGHQELASMDVSPPEGVSAYLRGVQQCSEAQANAGSCPAASKVGRAITGSGAGASPFYITSGEVFLTGPYKGAPLGLLIKVPALAGPFDLGTVNVRAAVHVDERTAQLRVISDSIPQILEGIPLRNRDIRVLIDRERFTVAPTDCDPKQVQGVVHGSHGARANVADRFQVADCAALDFAPQFGFHAVGRRATRPNGHPRLTAVVRFAEDEKTEANVKRASVILPRRMIVDQDNIATTCTREQFAERHCPENTIVGSATAHSPLLDEPLNGPVYLIASGNPLPDIVADLRGMVDIALFGRIHSQGIRVRNTFDLVPDVPVRRFRLTLNGGPDGILVNGANLCDRARFRRVDVQVDGQNGKSADQRRFIRAKRCARQRANRLERRSERLRQRARRAARNDARQRAQRLRQRANRLERRSERLKRRL